MKIDELKNMDADTFEKCVFRFLVLFCLSMESGVLG